MRRTNWQGKPYYSLDAWCKETLQHKCYKVALNAHMTCPNRDGTLGTRGCIFCSAGGSGEFAVDTVGTDIAEQLSAGVRLISHKLPDTETPCIIAYFQAYTNTYAPVSYLRRVFTSTLQQPDVCGISIATRPDCLPREALSLLSELKQQFPDKFIWVELGLQTIHENTATYIRRGYSLSCFETAVQDLNSLDIPVIVHVILGLPDETAADMLETIQYLNCRNIFGIKLQLLHVLQNTDLADCYEKNEFDVLGKYEYLDLLIACLENLSPEIVVHRVTGDGPKKLLIAPLWSCDKRDVLNSLHRMMRERNSYQGKQWIATQSER